MCHLRQKSASETEKYGWRKFCAIWTPKSSDTPSTMSMPPEKSAYIWME